MSDAPAPGPGSDPPDDLGGDVAPDEVADAATAAADADVPTGVPDAGVGAETAPSDGPAVAAEGPASDPIDGPEPEPVPEPELTPEPEAEAEAGPDPILGELAEVRAGLEAMRPDLAATAREETVAAGLTGLQKGLDEMVRLTRRADEHVAELHAENQRLRAGELAGATAPMIRDLVRLHDEVTRLAEASHPEAQADLQLVGSRLLDTLARWGLSPFTPAPGDELDATKHQGVGRVPSSDGEPGTIATVRRPGFAHDDGRTFRPAEVEVFAPPPPPPAPNDEE